MFCFFRSTFSLWFQRQANNFFANISSFTTQEACNEDQTYLFDMPSTFMSCTLKINNLTKSMLDMTANHQKHTPTTVMSTITRPGRLLIYCKGLPPIKSHNTLIVWSGEIMRQTKIILSPLQECL